MTINITNQPGGVIQNIDKPVVNIFGKVDGEDYKVVQQLLREDSNAEADSSGAATAPDPWRSYFKSDEDYQEAVSMTETCVRPFDVKMRVIDNLRRKGYKSSALNTQGFVECLKQHLIKYKGSKEIKSLQRSVF